MRIGYGHHRWFCERTATGLSFLAKTDVANYSRNYFITRDEIGRDLTPQEATIGFFWQDAFTATEIFKTIPGEIEAHFI